MAEAMDSPMDGLINRSLADRNMMFRPPCTETIHMLVLSRKKNEGIVIDGPCRIIVAGIRGETVRLGFEADPTVKICRDEVLAEIHKKERSYEE